MLPLAAERGGTAHRAEAQGRRRVARHQLRRARRGRQGDRARPDRPRHREGRPRLDPRHTRPEWTFANFGILGSGAASVSIYQTNSPEECHYVLDHSESRAVFVEDAEQLEKIREIEATCPHLEHVIVIEPDGDMDDAHLARRAARARPLAATTPSTTSASRRHPRRRLPLHLHVGHDRPAQGLHPHPRQLPQRRLDDAGEGDRRRRTRSSTSSSRSRTRSRC